MAKERPTCVHCGAVYGRRATKSENVVWPADKPMPEYRGNGIVVKTRMWRSGGSSGRIEGVPFGPGDSVAYLDVWDGETWWGGYDPFCTLRCALDYARRAYARAADQTLRRVK